MILDRAHAVRSHLARVLIMFLMGLSFLSFMFPVSAQRRLVHENSQSVSPVNTLERRTVALTQIAGVGTDLWKYKLRYQALPRLGRLRQASRITATEKIIQDAIQELNEQLSLPFDINISLETCWDANASYNRETRQVTICYEMIDVFHSLFSRTMKRGTQLNEAVQGAMLSLFFHEVGHALVDACDLPITGREEDAVDQLSTLILINSRINREPMALNGAQIFRILANREKHESKFFWDEHSTFAQRYYDTICLIYGHNPRKYKYMVTNRILPEERAENCGSEYERVKNAWSQLLGPYTRQSLNIH